MDRAGGVVAHGPTPVERDAHIHSVVRWLDHDDTRVRQYGDGPLAGLRIGVKDNIQVAGVPTTCGSHFGLESLADEDAAVVTSLRRAGALITATLDMAEWAVGVTSQNSIHGGPRNPWDLEHVPGGSSGGSGAAVAAGVVDAALGTDTGGSIRLPAAACGITGLRPTVGSVDVAGTVPVSPAFDTVGPMARDVVTVQRLFHAMRVPAPERSGRAPRTFGVPRTFVTDDVDPAITQLVEGMVEELRRHGFAAVPIDIPLDFRAQEAVYTFVYSDLADYHRQRLRNEPELFQAETLARISLGVEITEEQRREAARIRDSFRAGMHEVFSTVDAVITPTMPVDVPQIDEDTDAMDRTRRMGQLTYPWSLHSGPTLAVPVGFHPDSGMPVGAQITAAAGEERSLFTIGEAFQRTTDWHLRTPPTGPAGPHAGGPSDDRRHPGGRGGGA